LLSDSGRRGSERIGFPSSSTRLRAWLISAVSVSPWTMVG
jgi:hypothetical protein